MERALAASGVPLVKVNPRQARRFAEATGKLAKTDRLDAAILARMEARPARSEVLLELKELYVARETLVKDRTAAKNRGKALTLSLLKRQDAQRLEQIDRQIATVEAAILQIVEADATLSDRFAILTSIPGVSSITAYALLIAMPSLAPSKPARPPTWQVWPRSLDSQAVGSVARSFAADAPRSAKRSTCQPSSQFASIQTSGRNTHTCQRRSKIASLSGAKMQCS
jgi:transposase